MKYTITADTMNWTVNQVLTYGEGAKNPGEQYEKGITFHANLEQAATSLQDRLTREKCAGTDLDTGAIIDAVRAATEEVRAVVAAVQAK